MSEAKNTVKDDITLTKRATEKTAADVGQAQKEKQKQVCQSSSIWVVAYMYGFLCRICFWIIWHRGSTN